VNAVVQSFFHHLQTFLKLHRRHINACFVISWFKRLCPEAT
jgi:hypothetical protein